MINLYTFLVNVTWSNGKIDKNICMFKYNDYDEIPAYEQMHTILKTFYEKYIYTPYMQCKKIKFENIQLSHDSLAEMKPNDEIIKRVITRCIAKKYIQENEIVGIADFIYKYRAETNTFVMDNYIHQETVDIEHYNKTPIHTEQTPIKIFDFYNNYNI